MKIKIVDGFEIRNTLDPNFCAIEDSQSQTYVPKGELWLEKSYLAEKDRIVQSFLADRKLKTELGAEKYGAFVRRRITDAAKKTAGIKTEPFKIKPLGKSSGFKIFLVSGREVRAKLDPDFFLGGHNLIYDYVPKNEIWIDDAQDGREIKYTLLHELHEAKLMEKGTSYDNAHDFSLATEKAARRNDGFGHYPKDSGF
ncbi:MAG: hypothetical protein Q8L11_03375 [Candidatus Moranbacteria bacterium]|nr:hypothetical protein [bacterium]MDP1833948.1 hypothetical protein [Candidatus Moranbacteria bacterium]